MKTRTPFSNASGSALLMALWALLLLSAIVFAWVKFIDANMRIAGEENFGFDARALAHSGVQIAMSPAVTVPGDPVLQQTISPGHSFQVTLKCEDGRLNLNWVLQGGSAPATSTRLGILKEYLVLRGLKTDQINTIVDSLLDWIGPPGKPHPDGMEDSDDYHPSHRGYLLTLDEIQQVNGSAPLVSLPGWSDDFTLWSGDGKYVSPAAPIDLQYASSLLIQSLPTTPPITATQAQRLIDYRAGKDQIDGTADDVKLTEQMAAQYLGLPSPLFKKQTAGLVAYATNKTWRAVSVGQVANRTRQVQTVFTKPATGTPQVYFWQEF